MNQHIPKCYNIVLSTYGTRLLGDKRGTVRWDGTRFSRNDPLKEYMTENLSEEPFVMSFRVRAIVHDAIFGSAVQRRFFIDALNVRQTHIHLVICSLEGRTGDEIVRFIKYDVRCALEKILTRQRIDRIWTKSFSQSIVRTIGQWRRVVRYALLEQGSNAYLSQTKFATRVGLTAVADPAALYDAFHVEKNAFYRMKLFSQTTTGDIEEEADEEA